MMEIDKQSHLSLVYKEVEISAGNRIDRLVKKIIMN